MPKASGGGGRSSRVTPIRSGRRIVGYSGGGSAFVTKRAAQNAARRANAARRIPGAEFMTTRQLNAAAAGRRPTSGGGRGRVGRASRAGLSGAERSAASFRRAEMRETFRARIG